MAEGNHKRKDNGGFRIDLDEPLSAPLAIAIAGLALLTFAALVGLNVPPGAWATWGTFITVSLTGGALRGRGNDHDDQGGDDG